LRGEADYCIELSGPGATPQGKIRLHGISKRGDSYLRTLLIHGARSVLRVAARHTDPTTTWLKRVQARRNANNLDSKRS
jgi:transposase